MIVSLDLPVELLERIGAATRGLGLADTKLLMVACLERGLRAMETMARLRALPEDPER